MRSNNVQHRMYCPTEGAALVRTINEVLYKKKRVAGAFVEGSSGWFKRV